MAPPRSLSPGACSSQTQNHYHTCTLPRAGTEKGTKSILKEIMPPNFPNTEKEIDMSFSSTETFQDRRELCEIFKVTESKDLKQRRIKKLLDKKKLKEFVNTKPV